MAEIKSALELALEKAERYGKASREEMAAAQYQEQGRQLAVKFLKGEGDLEAGLKNLAPQAQDAARIAIKEVFLRNIGLPRNGEADERLERAVAGLLLVAGSKNNMARLTAELQQLLQQFLQFRNNAMQQLKARFCPKPPPDAAGHGGENRPKDATGGGADPPIPGGMAPLPRPTPGSIRAHAGAIERKDAAGLRKGLKFAKK